jgi:ribonucleotide reductase beta subunit family protein with ferritin-like domain
METEFLLNPENNRLTVYPLRYHDIWDSYKIQEAAFWTAEEIDFSQDSHDFSKLNDNEQFFIKMILSFFAASDTIVNINLGERFVQEIQIREAIIAYNFQMMMENIHGEVYSLMIDNIIKREEEKNKLFNALYEYPCIKNKIKWAEKWTKSEESFPQRLIAFAIVEGVFFSGSFCAIFWIKEKNIMPGLCQSNELISRDEGSHVDFACLLYSKIKNRLSEQTVHKMFKEAYEIEKEFICESLSCSLIGMNKEMMQKYIQFVSDRLLVQLGYSEIWKSSNPFPFMENISMEGKSNFFERKPTQYQHPFVLNKTKGSTYNFTTDF